VAKIITLSPESLWVRAVTSIIVRIIPIGRLTISANARSNSACITILAVAINAIVDAVIVLIYTTVDDIGAETSEGIQKLALNA
jgi:hypothetical protein